MFLAMTTCILSGLTMLVGIINLAFYIGKEVL